MSDEHIVRVADFEAARERASATAERSGIGTLGEKLVHRTLKLYLEPREECHEVPICGYVADILNESGVTEIQTRGFARMKEKLARFLAEHPVTLVYPVVACKEILWFDKQSGELVSRRRSSKHSAEYDLLSELSGIGELALHENLTLKVVLLRAEEYRLLDGSGRDRKDGATKVDIFPTELIAEREIRGASGLYELLPPLPQPFSAKDFASALRLRGIRASMTLRFARRTGIVRQVGKLGNAYLYETCRPLDQKK